MSNKSQVKISLIILLLVTSIIAEQVDTIVIGAGIAGTAAANKIASSGKSVIILQANDYVGGRLKYLPVQLSNNQTFKFELGGNWIHGSGTQNPLTNLSQNIQGVTMIQTDDSSMILYDLQKNDVTANYQAQESIYQQFMANMSQYTGMTAEAALNSYNSSLASNPEFMFNVAFDVEFQTSAPFNKLGAQYGQDDAKIQGTQMLIVSGYQAFPQYLSKGDKIQVKLNCKVIKVAFNESSSNSQVTCANGDSYIATNIVISVPLGVLKKNSIVFSPQLPTWKKQAIKQIAFGNVCKVLINLEKQISLQNQYIGVVDSNVSRRGYATVFLNLKQIAKLPALMTFGLGINADQIELLPQNQLKDLIVNRLNVFFEQTVTTDDFSITRSNWKSNANFGGAYSYSGVTTLPRHWQNMAKPIFVNKWYFSGQHTYSKYRGTVHGAYYSGIDAATSIIQETTQANWQYNGKS